MSYKIVPLPQPYALSTNIPATGISLCQPSNTAPRACFVEIDWSKYTTGNVAVDLLGVAAGLRIDLIKSVYIDNIGIYIPVSVYFPDTQMEAVCGADATLAQDVLTGQLQAQIILGQTSISLSSLSGAVTRVWFLNVPALPFDNPAVPTAVPEYEASNLPGAPQVFIPKAAGEQRAAFQFDLTTKTATDFLNGGVVTTNLFANYNMPLASTSYVIITDIKAVLSGYGYGTVIGNISGGQSTFSFAAYSGSIPTTGKHWIDWIVELYSGAQFDYRLLQDSHEMMLQIPWTTPMCMQAALNIPMSGTLFLDMQFTYISQI